MQMILIRHSKTPGNEKRRYIGCTDEPLSPEGITLAQQFRADFTVRTVYVTPLQRTKQTASILFPKADQIEADDLREMNFGDFEGRSYIDMEHDCAYRIWVEGGCLGLCPNGESREKFSGRVCSAFEKMVRAAEAQGEKTMVFVVHGGTIMAIMERFAYPRQDYYSYSVENCRGYRCRVELVGDLVLTDIVPWGRGIH